MSLKCTDFLYVIKSIIVNDCFVICVGLSLLLKTVDVTTIWVHFTSTGYYPTSIRLSRQIPIDKVCTITSYCCFKTMEIDWDNIVVTGISGITIDMPMTAKVSIFTDNDLTNIIDEHF